MSIRGCTYSIAPSLNWRAPWRSVKKLRLRSRRLQRRLRRRLRSARPLPSGSKRRVFCHVIKAGEVLQRDPFVLGFAGSMTTKGVGETVLSLSDALSRFWECFPQIRPLSPFPFKCLSHLKALRIRPVRSWKGAPRPFHSRHREAYDRPAHADRAVFRVRGHPRFILIRSLADPKSCRSGVLRSRCGRL